MDRPQPDSGESVPALLESGLYSQKMAKLSRNSTDAKLMKVDRLHNESHYHDAKFPAIIKNA
ncbi:MAG: hypothetical protein JF619_06135 [Massilia sp.]|nr:hypothetical protein [Massilia sp.]